MTPLVRCTTMTGSAGTSGFTLGVGVGCARLSLAESVRLNQKPLGLACLHTWAREVFAQLNSAQLTNHNTQNSYA